MFYSVAEGYLDYSKYRAVQHFASAVMHVLSTQVRFQFHINLCFVHGGWKHFLSMAYIVNFTITSSFSLHLLPLNFSFVMSCNSRLVIFVSLLSSFYFDDESNRCNNYSHFWRLGISRYSLLQVFGQLLHRPRSLAG